VTNPSTCPEHSQIAGSIGGIQVSVEWICRTLERMEVREAQRITDDDVAHKALEIRIDALETEAKTNKHRWAMASAIISVIVTITTMTVSHFLALARR
jgi:hypothetical protein